MTKIAKILSVDSDSHCMILRPEALILPGKLLKMTFIQSYPTSPKSGAESYVLASPLGDSDMHTFENQDAETCQMVVKFLALKNINNNLTKYK